MSKHHHRRSLGFRGDAANDNNDVAGRTCVRDTDAAAVIGLALAHARRAGDGSTLIPVPVMARLDALADRGDPACRMVRKWIRGEAEIISAAAASREAR
ncbi:hypothetical protein AB4Z52_12695 [Rhizobium sp. 2YAF20]|uniref:hypothetical protein n=1 Tax=Rhizobium sp. 2YAF20 TaxID=3233027 RepID=UPI003F98441B